MRPTCPACLRPRTACICHLTAIVHSDIEVLILQHPLEVTVAKGTARLLHLSLPNSHIQVSEVFEDKVFASPKHSILLYPVTPENHSLGISPPLELNPAMLHDLNNIRLVIIDGTWRKSRKILIKNPYLQTLPRLILEDLPVGQYTIRKAKKPHQLSTMEAASAALAKLESNATKFPPLNHAFLAFNAMMSAQMKL